MKLFCCLFVSLVCVGWRAQAAPTDPIAPAAAALEKAAAVPGAGATPAAASPPAAPAASSPAVPAPVTPAAPPCTTPSAPPAYPNPADWSKAIPSMDPTQYAHQAKGIVSTAIKTGAEIGHQFKEKSKSIFDSFFDIL